MIQIKKPTLIQETILAMMVVKLDMIAVAIML